MSGEASDMCKVANFNSLFEIAFSLSALFYYLEARAVIETAIEART
jgi:hypothetical protein